MRTEQDIFDELESLCRSPGYIHCIAYLAYRDTLVRYTDLITAEDLKPLFSPDRLVRTEISTLIGLLVKAEIDYTLPSPEVTQGYIDLTEMLLKELHDSMWAEFNFDLNNPTPDPSDLMSRGAVIRESIFYGPESAYSFQYRDLAPKKYSLDDEWLKRTKGFSILAARDVLRALGTLQNDKLTIMANSLRYSPREQWTPLPAFSFSTEEVSKATGLTREVVNNVVESFALPHEEKNRQFKTLSDFNAVNATPLLRNKDQCFILFQQHSLAEALYESPFYWIIADELYRPTAMAHRGQFTEEFSRERLEVVFGKSNVHPNVNIYEHKGEKVGEIDVLVLFGDRAIILQAKSKRLTLEARKGNDSVIKDDFKKSVQDSYDQALFCATYLDKSNLKFFDINGRELHLPRKLEKAYILCVVSDHYPALSFQVLQFLRYRSTDLVRPPFVMDIFTLDVLTEMLRSPLYFLNYVDKRTQYSTRVMASHELVLLSYHLKRNLWFEKDYDQILLEDDISVDLDVAMSVRRDKVPGIGTPEGILTRITNTPIGAILKEIEERADPATIDLGFILLNLSEEAVNRVSDAMAFTARKTLRDGKNHDVSIPLNEASAGLTIHCNQDPLSDAGPRLAAHCEVRKYAEKAKSWYGICIRPNDLSLSFGVNIDFPWEYNAALERAVSELRKRSEIRQNAKSRSKVGRNAPCPCGSGKKFKKCCLR